MDGVHDGHDDMDDDVRGGVHSDGDSDVHDAHDGHSDEDNDGRGDIQQNLERTRRIGHIPEE